mmetsp:Transcript_6344/g.25578  ORF Transcript_6344/g.25578 Transcript_6344/m.25578 type:complete len:225 (-) Transcript_6344:1589-2263(-)
MSCCCVHTCCWCWPCSGCCAACCWRWYCAIFCCCSNSWAAGLRDAGVMGIPSDPWCCECMGAEGIGTDTAPPNVPVGSGPGISRTPSGSPIAPCGTPPAGARPCTSTDAMGGMAWDGCETPCRCATTWLSRANAAWASMLPGGTSCTPPKPPIEPGSRPRLSPTANVEVPATAPVAAVVALLAPASPPALSPGPPSPSVSTSSPVSAPFRCVQNWGGRRMPFER